MSIGKKELKMAAVLCVLIYAFVFYKVIWLPVVPSIRDTQNKIEAALEKKDSLEKDYKNMEKLKAQLAAQMTSNERIDEYLMNSANMVDSLEYVDKLTRLIGDNIRELNIAKPEQKHAAGGKSPVADDTQLKGDGDGKTYYEIKMDFRAYMTYSSAMELVKYIEGGTRRVKITKFFVKALSENDMKVLADARAKQEQGKTGAPDATQAAQQEAAGNGMAQNTTSQAIAAEGNLFDTNMTISMYSANVRASDRMYEYSRHKLNKFIQSNGILLTSAGSKVSTGNLTVISQLSGLNEEFGSSDIVIKERSYLAAGENLQIFGVDRENDVFRLKTDSAEDIRISLTGNSYSINALEKGKKAPGISGRLPDKKVITLAVAVDMPDIKENDRIRLNIRINNNSDKDLNIMLEDLQRRVAVYDRKGNRIYSGSAIENTRII